MQHFLLVYSIPPISKNLLYADKTLYPIDTGYTGNAYDLEMHLATARGYCRAVNHASPKEIKGITLMRKQNASPG